MWTRVPVLVGGVPVNDQQPPETSLTAGALSRANTAFVPAHTHQGEGDGDDVHVLTEEVVALREGLGHVVGCTTGSLPRAGMVQMVLGLLTSGPQAGSEGFWQKQTPRSQASQGSPKQSSGHGSERVLPW